MIAHQDKGVHPPSRPGADLAQSRKKSLPVQVVAEGGLLAIAAIEQMIERSGKFDPSFACHRFSLPAA
jgi:hypothetical protein